MLFRICLIFGQFQAEVAKSVAYKKKKSVYINMVDIAEKPLKEMV